MVSVIVVTYNRRDLLIKCLDSVRAQSIKGLELIVVDNASADKSLGEVLIFYPEAKLIQNSENLFFTAAHNKGIDAAGGDFILCLNNDVTLDKNYLKEALSVAEIDERVGMVSGKILRMGRDIIDSTGLFLGRNRKPVERGYGRKDTGQFEKPGYVFGVSGACALYKRKMLMDIKDRYGYFDKRFGMYYEDLDLSWRARKRGWKAYYTPKAIAYHVRGATAVNAQGKRGAKFIYLDEALRWKYIRNRYRCIRKNDSPLNFLVNLPFIFLYDLLLWGYIIYSKLARLIRCVILKLEHRWKWKLPCGRER